MKAENENNSFGSSGKRTLPEAKADNAHKQVMVTIRWIGIVTVAIVAGVLYIAVFNFEKGKDALVVLTPLLTLGIVELRNLAQERKSRS